MLELEIRDRVRVHLTPLFPHQCLHSQSHQEKTHLYRTKVSSYSQPQPEYGLDWGLWSGLVLGSRVMITD
jgi:hypothetical protein